MKTMETPFERKLRVILRDNGYRLVRYNDWWRADSIGNGNSVSFSSKSLMGPRDQACPIIRDDRLNALDAS